MGAVVRIVTLTVNPALDVTVGVGRLVADRKLRTREPVIAPGGGGVNVARAARRLGADVLAVLTSGGATGERHHELLRAEGVDTRAVPVGDDTRENVSIDEAETGAQYRLVLPGPRLTDSEWGACLDAIVEEVGPGDVVVASGSLAPGAPVDLYARVARIARAAGAMAVVDASGEPLGAALTEGVDLVKPSRRELEELTGLDLADEPEQERAAAELVADGRAGAVALSLGGDGALLATPAGVSRGRAIEVERRSTIGAGDSFLAALVIRLAAGDAPGSALDWALAAGAAATLRPGTELCDPADVERLLRRP